MSSDIPPQPLPDTHSPSLVKSALAGFLSLVLASFFASAVVSLASDTLIVFFKNQSLAGVSSLFSIPTLLMALAVYGLMVLTPMVPKRFFLPLTLFVPVANLIALPLLIYFYRNNAWIAWGISLGQMIVCVTVFHRLRGSWKFRWPLFAADQLEARSFRWRNFFGFAAVHLFVGLPAVLIYLLSCGSVAVNHFTDGFVSLRPAGVTMQVRKYIRDDGKTVELVPMSHIGETEFYQAIAASFSPTAAVLMEGVSDKGNLLAEKVGYTKTAKDLGLAEQHEAFKPKGELVPADVDIGQFSKVTLECLKKTMLVHAKGINAATLPILMQPSPEDLPEKLMTDLLVNRNRHVLEIMQDRLLTSDHIIIPWGAAHMPGISEGVLKAGFHLQDTEDHVAIRFGGAKGG